MRDKERGIKGHRGEFEKEKQETDLKHLPAADRESVANITQEAFASLIANMESPRLYNAIPPGDMAGSQQQPLIAVCMGSDTDLATLRAGLALLDSMDIPYEVHITSAHRTPQYMLDFGRSAASRGFKVIIAAAGGAAHLPGMIASETILPVIGVPVKASSLDGLDSLMSIVQMPRGVPVATVGIGNSINAAVLAARIVATSNEKAARWVTAHLKKMDDENMEKERRMQSEGWQT